MSQGPPHKRRHLDHSFLRPEPSGLFSLPSDVLQLVFSLVADDPQWLYSTWALLCREANTPALYPTTFPKLWIKPWSPPIPQRCWREWKEIVCVIVESNEEETAEILQRIIEGKTCVQTLLICHRNQRLSGRDLQQAGRITGLRSLGASFPPCRPRKNRPAALDVSPQMEPCDRWLNDCPNDCDNALATYLAQKSPHTLILCFKPSLSPTLRTVLASSVQLRQLDLRAYGSDDLGWLRGLTRLRFLDLSACNDITDASLASLAHLHELRALSLFSSQTTLSEAGLRHLSGLRNLQQLDLGSVAELTDLSFLANLHQLQTLRFLSSRLTGAALWPLTELNLRCLTMTSNPWLQDGDLARLPDSLQQLDLAGCRALTDEGLANLARLGQLRRLVLGGCNLLTTTGTQRLLALADLQDLDLSGCSLLTDDVFTHLWQLRNLRKLGILHCSAITRAGADHFRAVRPEVTVYFP